MSTTIVHKEFEQSLNDSIHSYAVLNKTFMPTNLENDQEKKIVLECNNFLSKDVILNILTEYKSASKVLERECNLINNCTVCPQKNEQCFFFTSYGLPCKHIFYVREFFGDERRVRQKYVYTSFHIN